MKLQTTQQNLPATIEDLSKFVLVCREKLIAMKAEIRAIEKVNLAREVHLQKIEEERMLSELVLDAETKLGEMLRQVKARPGERSDLKPQCSDAPRLKRTKQEVIKDLGLEKTQAKRFEILAENKDLVEQVKAEARQNGESPTRENVLNIAKERKRRELQKEELSAKDYENEKRLRDALNAIRRIPTDDELPKSIVREWSIVEDGVVHELKRLQQSIQKLVKLYEQIRLEGSKWGNRN